MHRSPEALRAALDRIDATARRRRLRTVQAHVDADDGARVIVDGEPLINFCSNDYLGLAHHPELAEAQRRAVAQYGSGSGAAHLVTGHCTEHRALEEELAEFTGRQRALLFSSGYMANLGVIASFAGRDEIVLEDRLNHASLLDGARLAGARLLRYPHADAMVAAQLLTANTATSLLATDGVFSMDGDVAPLPALAAACEQANAWLLVDDAHGLGVLGAHGGGSLEQAGLGAAQVPLLMGTLGKALGTFGAFVAGDTETIEFLLQSARTYIYTTALPPAVAAAARAALRLCRTESWRRERLRALLRHWQQGAAQLELPLSPAPTAIQPLIIGDSASAVELSESLRAAGFWVSAIRPPTVPEGGARLRITLSAAHTEAQIDALLAALARLLPRVARAGTLA